MTVIEQFINYLSAEKQYSELTVKAYKDDICQFLLYNGLTEEDFCPRSITATELRSFVMHLKERKLKHSSVNRKISTLKSFFTFALRHSLIEHDPTQKLSLLKKEKTLPSFVPLTTLNEQQENLLSVSDDLLRERDSLIILLFYATGIRVAELVSITLRNINLNTMEIKVHGKGDKQRIIPLARCLEEKLKNFIELSQKICINEKNLLFLSKKNKPISRYEVYSVVKRQLSDMGVAGKKSPHTLRHSFATHLLNSGAGIESVKELLGHSSLAATQIYTHNNIGVLVNKYNKAHPRASNNKSEN